MVLIGLMSGMAMLAMGNADHSKQQQLEAERLAKLLELAEQEAMIRGDSIGLELVSRGYRFLVLDHNEWQPETGDALFRQRDLDARTALSLKLDEKAVFLSSRFGGKAHLEPQIVFAPDGASESFQIGIALQKSDNLIFVGNTTDDGVAVSTLAVEP